MATWLAGSRGEQPVVRSVVIEAATEAVGAPTQRELLPSGLREHEVDGEVWESGEELLSERRAGKHDEAPG